MDAADLRVFAAVAREGGMARAALALNTVQSAVTARIARLEQDLGTTLFLRQPRGVRLTEAGERLLPYAERMAQLLAEARAAVADEGEPRGRLLLGSLETTAALRLAAPLAGFIAAHPAVDLTLRTGTSCELVRAVLARDLAGAFVCGPVAHAELTAEPVFREELVLLTAPRLGALEAVLAAPALKLLVLRAGCSYRQRLEDILVRRGVVGTKLLEFGTIEAILGCVAAGLGVTLMPRGLAEASAQRGRIASHRLPSSEAMVETLFIRRAEARPSRALLAFVNEVRPLSAAAE